jgi:site-specific DNA-methyltransferase (cytosine-N4-specific)
MTPYFEDGPVTVYHGHVLDVLRSMPDESVNCVVTSPPYWGLRDYGIEPSIWAAVGRPLCDNVDFRHVFKEEIVERSTGRRQLPHGDGRANDCYAGRVEHPAAQQKFTRGFCINCGAWLGCLGLEPTPQLFIEHCVEIFQEVRRVLVEDGTCWVNLGDSYASSSTYNTTNTLATVNGWKQGGAKRPNAGVPDGLKPKDLVGIPWRFAFALQADGWWLRQDIIWSKPNPMPESVTDRCTKAHEYIFLLTKSAKYYFNQEAILEPVSLGTHARLSQNVEAQIGSERANGGQKTNGNMKAVGRHLPGNKSHKGTTAYENGDERQRTKAGLVDYAVRMRKLAEAGSGIKSNESFSDAVCCLVDKRNKRSVWTVATEAFSEAHFATFPTELIKPCILAGCPPGGIVLDPFAGSLTTMQVARELNCKSIGIELNASYIDIGIRCRLRQSVLDFTQEPVCQTPTS